MEDGRGAPPYGRGPPNGDRYGREPWRGDRRDRDRAEGGRYGGPPGRGSRGDPGYYRGGGGGGDYFYRGGERDYYGRGGGNYHPPPSYGGPMPPAGGDRGAGGAPYYGGGSTHPAPMRDREKHRSRSRSPAGTGRGGVGSRGAPRQRRNRDISTSRERSRSRERRRRRMQAECIRRAGGFQKLADSEGHEPIRLFWDGFQWVAKTGAASNQGGSDAATMNSTRKLRRLYFGNLPLHLGLTESTFQEVVWNEMKARGFCNDPEANPVLYVWFAKDKGNYGFVEFSSVEETERALTMDGMLCMGIPLKVSRPNDYSTTSSAQTQAMSVMGQQAAAMLIGQLAAPGGPPAGTTRFLRIMQIVDPSTLKEEEDYEDLLEDVKEGCEKAGKIVSALVISPKNKALTPFELCDVVLEYGTPQEVDACIVAMAGRKYMGRPLSMVRLEETTFQQYIAPLLHK